MASAPAISGAQLSMLIGPFFVGSMLNWALLGTLCVQTYIYYSSNHKDRLVIKILVYGTFILDLVQTVLATHAAWALLVGGWGDLTVLMYIPWSVCTIPFISGIISAIVQIFFGWRIWILNHTRIMRGIVVLIILIALVQSLSAIVASIRFALVLLASELPKYSLGFSVWLIGSFICDILIAASMMFILSKARATTPFKATDTLVARLMVHTVQTGLVTAITAGVEVVLFLVFTQNNLHFAPAFMLGKLYSNVLLATLNARTRSTRLPTESTMAPGEVLVLSTRRGGVGTHAGSSEPGVVHISTEVFTDDDCSVSKERENEKLSAEHSGLEQAA